MLQQCWSIPVPYRVGASPYRTDTEDIYFLTTAQTVTQNSLISSNSYQIITSRWITSRWPGSLSIQGHSLEPLPALHSTFDMGHVQLYLAFYRSIFTVLFHPPGYHETQPHHELHSSNNFLNENTDMSHERSLLEIDSCETRGSYDDCSSWVLSFVSCAWESWWETRRDKSRTVGVRAFSWPPANSLNLLNANTGE